jgi:putative acetyltransferase
MTALRQRLRLAGRIVKNTMPVIREETPEEFDAIRSLNRLAFGGNFEAELVDRLRSAGVVVLSLVAVENDEIVGHILFSALPIETKQGVIEAVSLAPMSVNPKLQRQGIGSALVRQGLEICRERGQSIVVVLGHPGYYPRFGFSAELARNLHGPFSGEAWMALELRPGALDTVKGMVRYPEAFGVLER